MREGVCVWSGEGSVCVCGEEEGGGGSGGGTSLASTNEPLLKQKQSLVRHRKKWLTLFSQDLDTLTSLAHVLAEIIGAQEAVTVLLKLTNRTLKLGQRAETRSARAGQLCMRSGGAELDTERDSDSSTKRASKSPHGQSAVISGSRRSHCI